MTKQDLLQQLAALNHQINEELSKTELPRSSSYRCFPTTLWALAALCMGWWLFGQIIPYAGSYHASTSFYAFVASVLLALLALFRTLLWLFQPKRATSVAYIEATKRIRQLQEQRRQLQEEIKALEE